MVSPLNLVSLFGLTHVTHWNHFSMAAITLNQLTESELAIVAKKLPRFVFAYRPHYMVHHYFDWMVKYEPKWVATHYPRLMVERHPDWICFHSPGIMADHNLEYLLTKNPEWVVKNMRDHIAYSHPEILREYDQSLYEIHRSEGTREKGRVGILERLYKAATAAWPKSRKADDPILPVEVVRCLDESMRLAETEDRGPVA